MCSIPTATKARTRINQARVERQRRVEWGCMNHHKNTRVEKHEQINLNVKDDPFMLRQ